MEDKKEDAVSENNIINNIYTAVIEAQAKDALASEQLTGYIPEFEDEETEEAKLEWIKVYGILLGCEEAANAYYESAIAELEAEA